NLVTLLQIFCNADNLQFYLHGSETDGRFCCSIFNGSQHQLAVSEHRKTREEIIACIKTVLNLALTKGKEVFLDKPENYGYIFQQTLKSLAFESKEIPSFLTEKMVQNIILSLEKNWATDTADVAWQRSLAA